MDINYISGKENFAELQSKRKSSDRLVLTRAALLKFIERFLTGVLTASELQDLADLMEGEPVDYDDESPEHVVASVVFKMSAPEVNGPIDRAAAERWIKILRPS